MMKMGVLESLEHAFFCFCKVVIKVEAFCGCQVITNFYLSRFVEIICKQWVDMP
uniref:Uncharacterized protein n=1 Tax=Arundo donax TaxID=35708 RepID=A0A0A8ZXQ0_ARUDO